MVESLILTVFATCRLFMESMLVFTCKNVNKLIQHMNVHEKNRHNNVMFACITARETEFPLLFLPS